MVAVWIAPVDTETSKGLVGSAAPAVLKELDPQQLNASLKKLAADMEVILSDVATAGGYCLDQIAIGAEINGEAGINLIGTAKVGGKATITLTFARAQE